MAVGAIALVGPSAAGAAATYTVATTADSPASPCSLANVCTSLRAAVAAANSNPGSTIMLGSGTYVLDVSAGDNAELFINNPVTITGAGAGATTVEQTASNKRVFRVAAGPVVLSGLTITGAVITGAASVFGSTAATAVFGGGIYIDPGGNLTLDHAAVTGNSITGGRGTDAPGAANGNGDPGAKALGAGIFDNGGGGALTLQNSTVSGNHATGGAGGAAGLQGNGGAGGDVSGGGIAAAGTVVIRNSTISGNTAAAGAGGSGFGSANSSGQGGTAKGAGVAFGIGGSLSLVDSTLSANAATGGTSGAGSLRQAGGRATAATGGASNGGGLSVTAAAPPLPTVQLSGTTLSANTATGGTGGAHTTAPADGGPAEGGGLYLNAPVTVINSTFAGNAATGGPGGAGSSASANAGSGDGGAIGDDAKDPFGPTVPTTSLVLASDTLAGNAASTFGGNLDAVFDAPNVANTILAGGTAPNGSDCVGVGIIASHDLESDPSHECLFFASDDISGQDPRLGALADNGGPTKTMALGAGSPALGAGGACTDPLHGNAALTLDQRGLPRGVTCDIGAFQGQRVTASGSTVAAGSAVVGGLLTCTPGRFAGDAPLTVALQWLRGGGAIAAATSAAYTVVAGDAGATLSCRATATNAYGSVAQTSNSLSVPAPTPKAPVISRETLNPTTFAAASSGPSAKTARRAVGSIVSFTLDKAATVRFTVVSLRSGRKAKHGRCVPRTSRNRKARKCQRLVTLRGGFSRTGKPGKNRFRFTGRLAGKKLPVGSYELVARATAAGHTGAAKRAKFRVVR